MASTRWQGNARAQAQVTGWLFGGAWIVGETVTVTIGTKAWTYTLTSGTIATFLPLLATAYNALAGTSYPEMAEQTASSDSTHFILTADTAGKPFTAVLSTNSAAGTIGAGADTTASAGPNDVSTAANYSGAAVPGNGDTLNIDPDATSDLRYGLATLAAVTGLTINYTGAVKVGLPPTNADGTAYPEYRQTYLQTAGGTVNVGATTTGQAIQGGDRFKHDGGSTQTTWNVYLTGFGQDSNLEAVLLKGTHASNVLNVVGQSQVGVAVFGGEVATLLNLRVTGQNAYVRCGSGVTLGTVTNDGGTLELNSAVGTALNHDAGTTTINGSGAVAQLTGLGGVVAYNTSGTLGGTTQLHNGCLLSFAGDSRAKTVTNAVKSYSAGNVYDPLKVAASLAVNYYGSVPDAAGFGPNCKVTRAAVD
jgi:hypothetical protein